MFNNSRLTAIELIGERIHYAAKNCEILLYEESTVDIYIHINIQKC